MSSGPYGVVRHPIYLSMLGMMLTTALLLDVWWQIVIAAAIFIAGTEIRVREEDKLLEGRFGDRSARSEPAFRPICLSCGEPVPHEPARLPPS